MPFPDQPINRLAAQRSEGPGRGIPRGAILSGAPAHLMSC